FHVGPSFPNQATGVDEDLALAHFVFGQALGEQGRAQEAANTDPGGARADQHKALLAQGLPNQAQAGQDAGQGHGGGALDVVIEAGQAARVAAEQAKGIGLLEVLPLQQLPREHALDRAHELFDEGIVLRPAHAASAVAQIKGVGGQRAVIGTDVKTYRQCEGRRDTGAGGVQDKFADGNGHAARALIAEAQDALVVGDDDEADVPLAEVAEALRDLAAVVGAKEQSARAAIDMAVLLAGAADRGGVDDRGKAFEVLDHQPVEEDFVAIQQGDQADVLLERIALLEDVLQLHSHLLLDGEHRRRQQPLDAQLFALGVREGGVFVLRRVAKNLLAARPVDVRGRLWVHSLQYKGQFKISLRPWKIAPLRKAAIPPGQYSIPIVLGNLFPLAPGLRRVNWHSFRFSCRCSSPLKAVRRP